MKWKISKDEAVEIACQDSERFEHVEEIELGKEGRWTIGMETIVKEVATGKFFCLNWSAPATENQGGIEDQFYGEQELYEVHKIEVVTHEWAAI